MRIKIYIIKNKFKGKMMSLIQSIFNTAHNWKSEIALLSARREFTHALTVAVNTFCLGSDTHDRVFKKFKKEYLDRKKMFETTPEFSSRLGWQNFIDLMALSTQDLEEDNYFDIDTLKAMAIKDGIEKLNKTWDRLSFDHQQEIDNEGIIFEGYDNVTCIDFVNGILGAEFSSEITAAIVNHHVYGAIMSDLPPMTKSKRNVNSDQQP